jgi:hypothetical protein
MKKTVLVLAMLFVSSAAHAQYKQTERPTPAPEWLKLDAEYRVQSIYIDPLDLNGEEVTRVNWTEQRLRLDLGMKYKKVGGIYLKLDALNGVLFGDNGRFGGSPSPTNGLALASKRGNNAGWEVAAAPGRDPLDPNSYIPVLKEIEPIQVTFAYGEVVLPVGLLRVGRMAQADAAGIAAHDGERRNRWGVSRSPDTADRVLFATKLDAIYNSLVLGPDYVANPSIEEGLILAFTYDWNVQDDIHIPGDDQGQTNVYFSARKKEADWFGWEWRNLSMAQVWVRKRSKKFDTDVQAFPFRFEGEVGDLYVNFQLSWIAGESREVSEGIAALSGKVPTVQKFEQRGLHSMIEYSLGPVDLTMEFDYGSGDADVRSDTPISSFSFSRDYNVGLLMFEHILAFQTARSAALGVENLINLDSDAFPVTEIGTEGRFTNAVALFPQVKWNIVRQKRHKLHLRLGVLAAWSDEPVVDPVATSLREDGNEISDDALNFAGGKPGNFYGVEYDAQVQWTYEDFFVWTVEAAHLRPGDAFEDRNGLAVPASMVENRFEFLF